MNAVNLEAAPGLDDSATEQRVGSLIKSMRLDRGLSVRTLASLAGFSPSFISQVEHGHVSPSISSLERLVDVLGESLGGFFQRLDDPSTTVVRADQRTHLDNGWSRARIAALGPTGPACSLESLLITLQPGGRSAANPSARPGDEFALVLRGRVILENNGHMVELNAGDAVTLPAGAVHQWQSACDEEAELLLVLGRPTR